MKIPRVLPFVAAAALVAAFAVAPPAAAQESARDTQWGVGFHSSFPSYGLSVQYDISDQIVAQGILGAFGTVSNLGARGLYRFQRERVYDLFGYGAVGVWRWGGSILADSESAVGVGGGAGIELNWQEIITPDDYSFPPIFSSIELGFTTASFRNYNLSGFIMGGGIHYRF